MPIGEASLATHSTCDISYEMYRHPMKFPMKECVAVLIGLYKINVTVSCVGSDLLSEWAHAPQWWW